MADTRTGENRTLLVVLAVVAAVVVLPPLVMLLVFPILGLGMGMGVGGAVPGVMALVAFLTFLVVIVGGGLLLFRAVLRSGDADPALEELRMAYARGELDDEEFERRKENLRREE